MQRCEIWLINLDPTLGAVINKTRPAMIISHDAVGILPLRVVIPITEWKDHYTSAPWLVRLEPDELNNLDKVSAVDTFQIRSLSIKRFVRFVGKVTPSKMSLVERALQDVLGV